MDFEGPWLKVITFLFYLESWNPISKTLKIRDAWCRLLGFPADASPAPALPRLSSGHHGMFAHICSLLPFSKTKSMPSLSTWISFLCFQYRQSLRRHFSPRVPWQESQVHWRKSGCTVSTQSPSPPIKGSALHWKNYSKSSSHKSVNSFIILLFQGNTLKVLPHFKTKAGIQETTVKEMKHNVNVWLTASLLELETPTDTLVN